MAYIKKIKAASKSIEPETESTGPLESGSGVGGKAMSKSAAARAAIAAGIKSPQKASAFILKQYGIEMTPQHFSSVKSQLKKKTSVTPRSAWQTMTSVQDNLAYPPYRAANGEADMLETLEALKPLVEQFGSERVKRMVDLLG